MRTIWKYPLPLLDEFSLLIPRGAVFLTVQVQNDTGCLWAEVHDEQPMIPYKFRTFGTGHPLPEDTFKREEHWFSYIGTYQLRGFVWHIYEEIEGVNQFFHTHEEDNGHETQADLPQGSQVPGSV